MRVASWRAWCDHDAPDAPRLALRAEVDGRYWLYWRPTDTVYGPYTRESALDAMLRERLWAWNNRERTPYERNGERDDPSGG